MARPVKNYCDYFPHDRDMRNHRKIKAIRTKYKIVGYGIWCMVLEYLTGIDGNVFEFSEVEMELMAGDFGVSATEIRDVVDYCIKLELLFLKDGFIHSESLDERLKPVYDKRGVSKSKSKKQSRVNGKFSTNNADSDGVSVAEMPQSKVNKSKEEESKVNNTDPSPSGSEDIFNEKKNKMPKEGKKSTFRNPFTENFIPRWDEWKAFKKEQHKFTYKPIGEQAAIDHLYELSAGNEEYAWAIIKQSRTNGWKGLFDLKQQFNGEKNKRESSGVGKTIEFDRP